VAPVPDLGGMVGGLVGGLVSLAGTVASTALGAVMAWLGRLVNVMGAVAAGVLSFLPDAEDLGLEIPGGWLVGYSWFNEFFPVAETLVWLGVLTAAMVIPVVWHLAVTVYHLIPKPWMGT